MCCQNTTNVSKLIIELIKTATNVFNSGEKFDFYS